jgi:hypothetical protein
MRAFPEQGRISNSTPMAVLFFWPITAAATIPRTRKRHKETNAMVLLTLSRAPARR